MMYSGFPYSHMENLVRSIDSAFCHELLQYEIPHSAIIPNIPKYDKPNGPNEHIDTYEWMMASLRMDKQFI